MELRGGLFWSCGPHTQWTVRRTPPIIRTLIQLDLPGRSLGLIESPWFEHRISCGIHAQQTVMRVMHVTLPSHSARGRYVVKAASQCTCAYPDHSLAMCLLQPSSLPQCVFAYPTCLRNASSPMSAPANASAPIVLTNAFSQCGCVFRSFATLRQDAAMCVYIYIYTHTYTQTCASKCVEKDFGLLFCLRLHASATHFQYSFNIKKNSISQQPPTHMHM